MAKLILNKFYTFINQCSSTIKDKFETKLQIGTSSFLCMSFYYNTIDVTKSDKRFYKNYFKKWIPCHQERLMCQACSIFQPENNIIEQSFHKAKLLKSTKKNLQ